MITRLRLHMEPKGKERQRFGNGHTYTPKRTRDYENTVAEEYRKLEYPMFARGKGVRLRVEFYKEHPKSWTKEQVRQWQRGELEWTSKADLDNLLKAIMDGLTKAGAWHDDSQVVRIETAKEYASESYIDIVLYDADEERICNR